MPLRDRFRRRFRPLSLLVALGALLAASPAWSMGLLIPNQDGAGPLAIESHRVTIQVRDNLATTHVDEVFRNSSPTPLEATFVFPVPEGATVHDFALWMNGERVNGEILESSQARQVYEQIVRRSRDPGLVEYVDGSIFQASIFPVPANGTQRVELDFAQVLDLEGDLHRLTYPLRTGRTSATTLTDFTLTAEIDSSLPIRALYSPSHEIDVDRDSETHATIGLEQQQGDLERDFVLYLSTSDEEVGLSLFTFDEDGPDEGEDGYFLMLLSPRLEREDEIAAKDVTFVVDASGSMEGAKLEQAQEMLRYCVGQLNEADRFNIVRFSTTNRLLFDDLTPATEANVASAQRFISRFSAAGGTGIEAALDAAVAQTTDPTRPHFIIFVTDGLPTVGETSAEALVARVEEENPGARVFTFGVGYDVDTQLLDLLAELNGGTSDYVHPDEDIEVAVSNLYNRIAHPVLTDVRIDFGAAEVEDVYPPAMPDLFAGEQVVLSGRFTRPLESEVTLAGYAAGEERAYQFRELFAAPDGEAADANDFIPQLWATRKIGFLIDQIRLNGEQPELAEEVRTLGLRYGLVTPYTSYLALDESELAGVPVTLEPNDSLAFSDNSGDGDWTATRSDRPARAPSFDPAPEPDAAAPWGAEAPGLTVATPTAPIQPTEVPPMLQANLGPVSGAQAVERSEEGRRLRDTTVLDEGAAVRQIGSRRFEQDSSGAWREHAGDDDEAREQGASRNEDGEDGAARVVVRYLSEAYFEILMASNDETRRVMALGESVSFRMGSTTVEVSPTAGVESLDAPTRTSLGL